MERAGISDFRLGLWEHTNVDMRQPQGSLGQADDWQLDESGALRARGAVTARVASSPTLTNPGVFAWAGQLLPGFREVLISSQGAGLSGRLFVMDDAGTAYSAVDTSMHPSDALSVAVVGNVLHVSGLDPGTPAGVVLYAGSRKTAVYSPTNVQFTNGSAVVTRAAGGFTANVDAGMLCSVGSMPWAVVKTVDSDTQVTLDRLFGGSTVLGPATFRMNAIGLPQDAAAFTSLPLKASTFIALGAVAGRLLVMQGNVLLFSNGPEPVTGTPRTGDFPARNRHEFPPDADAVALATLRDRVFVCTKAGIYAVSGMAYEIVDASANPQHQIDLVSSQLVALDARGIASWAGSLIVPCRDGIYAIDGVGAPVRLTRGLAWDELVTAGVSLGWATIHQGRYLLPVTSGGVTWTYALRLDGVDTEQGTVFTTTKLVLPGDVAALAASRNGAVLAAPKTAAAGALEAGKVFAADSSGVDEDGSGAAAGAVVVMAPVALGDKGLVRRVRLRYTSSSSVSATLVVQTADYGDVGTPTGALRSVSADVHFSHTTDWVAVDVTPLEAASVRVKLTLLDAAVEFVLHAVEVQYRAFGGR